MTSYLHLSNDFVPVPHFGYVLTAASVVLIAFGIFLYVPADFVPLAGEGTIAVIAELLHFQFSRVKIVFDVSMVAVSLITCLIFIHSLGSVGAGTRDSRLPSRLCVGHL